MDVSLNDYSISSCGDSKVQLSKRDAAPVYCDYAVTSLSVWYVDVGVTVAWP